jgi:hypothetical protein
MGTKRNIMDATFDAALQLKDAGAITATGAGQVASVARVVNLGAAVMQGAFVVDISALDVTSADETYDIRLQVSSDPTFATDVTIAARVVGGASAVTAGQDVMGVGRMARPFNNIGEDGAPKAYARVYGVLGGTTPSINYTAMITQNPLP